MPDLSVIIISYNTKDLTLACLQSVYEQTKDVSFEIIVVDNNSHDGSATAIATIFPNANLIKSSENLGFAGANNLAANQAAGKYLLLLNPDTVVLDNAIDKLFSFANAHNREGIFGGRTFSGDGQLDPTSCWKKPSVWSVTCYALGLTSIFRKNKFFDPESYGSWQRNSVKEVDIITGCFLLIHKSLWNKLNGFSPDFFMYAEEADLCLRAIKMGAIPILYPDAKIIHYGGASETVHADKMVKMLRAKITLIRKHWHNKLTIWMAIQLYQIAAFIRAWPATGLYKPNDINLEWRSIWSRRQEWTK